MYVLLEDDLGRLVLRRLRFWHWLLARVLAARYDRQLAAGARPETRPILAARAIQLTSARFRADLAASLRGLLADAGAPEHAGSPGIPGEASQPGGTLRRTTAGGRHLQTPRRPGDRPSHGVRTASELALLAGAGRSGWPGQRG